MNKDNDGISGIEKAAVVRVIVIRGPVTTKDTLNAVTAEYQYQPATEELVLSCQGECTRSFTVPFGKHRSVNLKSDDVFVICNHAVQLGSVSFINPDEKEIERKWKLHCEPAKCGNKTEQAFFYVEDGIGVLRFTILDTPATSLRSSIRDDMKFPQKIRLLGTQAIQKCDGPCPAIPRF